ncbi:hypothetical protein APICC_02550 [Apis cerana cerana]|uniref:Uncharacterized protein n=1 Tax=Apis cerana cerana TaxID=94128 RepID=A0A2A3EH78_APICC|nr:hypothetical protein APICC_02550 [Apis cerana cerana]
MTSPTTPAANFGSCKESRSFTSALERLELEAEIESRNDTIPLRRTSDAQTEPSDDTDQDLFGLNARDMLPYRKNVQHSDILNFQTLTFVYKIMPKISDTDGVMHSPEDIARYWKKDSRMWLWKSVKLMRRKNKLKSSNMCAINIEKEEE